MAASGPSRGGAANIDPRAAAVEASDFPILCESCLGPNPYVRMLQDKWGRPCKVCERPFTVFRWKPAGDGMRYKNTEVCQTCARLKNVCQTCVLDLVYGLPVQVRDAGMAPADRQVVTKPTSDIARQYTASQGERALATGKVDAAYAAPMSNAVADKAKRVVPRYDRNRAQLCSWFAKGKCARGVYCQYRHELPKDKAHPFSKQNIQDRYYGVNDPVAASIIARTASSEHPKRKNDNASRGQRSTSPPTPPDDKSITSLFVGGVTPAVTEPILRALFDKPGDTVSSVRLVPAKSIAFVDFTSREAAETAISERHGRIELVDAKLSIGWARSSRPDARGKRPASTMVGARGAGSVVPDISGVVPFVQPPPRVAESAGMSLDLPPAVGGGPGMSIPAGAPNSKLGSTRNLGEYAANSASQGDGLVESASSSDEGGPAKRAKMTEDTTADA